MAKIKVMIADDHRVVRQGLKLLIEARSDMEVTGEAGNGHEAVALAGKTKPDVVLMDLMMPQMNGLEATKRILRKHPASKVLVLSSYSDDDSIEAMMQAGVVGFLTKHSASEDVLKAIQEVQAGNAFFSPSVAQRIRRRRMVVEDGSQSRAAFDLTPRESDVLRCVAAGMPNKKTATHLGISVKTVEKHRQQVMNKLNIHEIAGLTRYALAKGLLEGQA
jgi:DNA-binding NarL/FixJ family response regulator